MNQRVPHTHTHTERCHRWQVKLSEVWKNSQDPTDGMKRTETSRKHETPSQKTHTHANRGGQLVWWHTGIPTPVPGANDVPNVAKKQGKTIPDEDWRMCEPVASEVQMRCFSGGCVLQPRKGFKRCASLLFAFAYLSVHLGSICPDGSDGFIGPCVDTVSFRPSQSHTYGLPHAVLCFLSVSCFISQAPQMESL